MLQAPTFQDVLEARRVIFAPTGGGHLLLWAMLAQRAGWDSAVVTVPAMGLLERVLRRPATEGMGALVVGNPSGDLHYAEVESRQVATMLGVRPLVGPEATREAMNASVSAWISEIKYRFFFGHFQRFSLRSFDSS